MSEFWFKRNKWLATSVIVFIIFLTSVVVLEIVYIPLWVALGTIAAASGTRFTNKFIYKKSPISMNFFSQFSYDSGIESADIPDKSNREDELKRQQQPPDELIPELEQYTNIIMKKYISSWYANLSNNDQFPSEIEYAFEDLIVALVSRIRHLNSKLFATKVVLLYHKYFQTFVRARHQSKLLNCKVEDVFGGRHYALTSEKSEEEHLFNLVNVLIEVLVPADILCCPVGRRLVVSLLVYQVLLPFVNLVADPYYFYRTLTALLGCDLSLDSGGSESSFIETPKESVATKEQTISSGNQSFLELDQSASCSSGEIKVDKPKEIWQRLADDLPSSLKSSCQKEMALSNENKVDKISSSNSLDRISDLFSSGLSFGGFSNYFRFSETLDRNQAAPNVPKKEEEDWDIVFENDKLKMTGNEESAKSIFQITSGLEELLNVTAGPVLSDTLKCARQCIDELQIPKLKTDDQLGPQNNEEVLPQTDLTNSKDVLRGDNLLNFQGNPFVKLQIPKTEVVEVSGIGSHYAIYCIQYDAWYPDSTSIKTEEIGSYVDVFEPKHILQAIIVKRRFREFVTLHSRLEDELKQNLFFKSIKGPNKWSIIPFSKLDKETIATRRLFLENYLQTLISNFEISSCKCFREFLAYGGDVEAAFVRKPIDLGQFVPRIDKMLVKKMTGVLDKLKTALPSLPSESFSSNHSSLQTPSPVETTVKASDRFLGYFNLSSSGSQDSNPSLSFDFGSEEETSISLENRISRYLINYDDTMDSVDLAFDAYEMDQWIKDPWSPISTSSPISQLQNKIFVSQEMSTEIQNEDTDLSGALINLLVEIFTNNSIFNKDNFVNTLKLLFGNSIDGWLIKILNCYMSEEAFAKYLPIIRTHLWSENSGAEISFKDVNHYFSIAQQAIVNNIPGVIKVVVGKDHIEESVNIFLASFKSPKLARHLVYNLIDLLVDDLLVKSRSQSILDKLGSIT